MRLRIQYYHKLSALSKYLDYIFNFFHLFYRQCGAISKIFPRITIMPAKNSYYSQNHIANIGDSTIAALSFQ